MRHVDIACPRGPTCGSVYTHTSGHPQTYSGAEWYSSERDLA